MRLFEAILDANHRALAGDARAGLRPTEFPDSLPVAVLTCFDPRLHPLMPEVLGVSEADFIWVTNAGNLVTTPLSSACLTLGLACVTHGAKEIAVIGHTDCLFCHLLPTELDHHLRSWGIETSRSGERVKQFLQALTDERTNVIRSTDSLRNSPLIPKHVPVHGLLVDVGSGRLDWVVNGYPHLPAIAPSPMPPVRTRQPPPKTDSPPTRPPVQFDTTRAPDYRVGGDLPPIGTF